MVGVLLSFIYSFKIIAFKNRIDLIQVFVLLIPCIVFRYNEDLITISSEDSVGWLRFYMPTLFNVFILGPVALSVKLGMCLGVLVRLFMNLKKQTNLLLFVFWIVSLVLSIYGLYLAKTQGMESLGGLTVGFRIVLAIGAVLIPLAINKEDLKFQLVFISKLSIIFLLCGVLIEHWLFMTVAMPPFLYFTKGISSKWKVICIFTTLIILLSSTTFTIKLIVVFSWLFVLAFEKGRMVSKLVTMKFSRWLIYGFPIIFMIYIVNNKPTGYITNNSDDIFKKFKFKLFEDRGGIWSQTYEMISESNFFVVPAGRDIEFSDSNVFGDEMWGAGAHNIYLEIARQNGLFVGILLSVIFSVFIFSLIRKIKYKELLSRYILISIAVYIVYGLTGNSLVYDGVGFLFWLIIGQLYNIINLKNTYEGTSPIRSRF